MGRKQGEHQDFGHLRELLERDEPTKTWLRSLEAMGEPEVEVALPSADELPPLLIDLAVPHEDIDDVVALLPTPDRSTDLWWLLKRCTHSLVREMGAVHGSLAPPSLPTSMGILHRYFYIYVFLAALPHVRAYHRTREIPEDVSRRTLADLGRKMAVYRRRQATGGLDDADWLMLHFRGAIYDLGRLQFQRGTLGNRTGQAIAAAGLPFGPGDPALAVHIPEFYGPLSPRACDESFERATEFFSRHFPEERYEIAVCHSWLLDDQLAEYLPENANIIRFQRRFRHAYRPDVDDDGIVRFVFGRTKSALEELPYGTTLERAVVDHLKVDRHWHGGAGWLRL